MAVGPASNIQERIQEARDRVMSKVDQMRLKLGAGKLLSGGNPGNPKILDRLKKRPMLQNLGLRKGKLPLTRKYTRTGPRQQISTTLSTRNGLPFFHDSHTKSPEEIRAIASRARQPPLQMNGLVFAEVTPKPLSK